MHVAKPKIGEMVRPAPAERTRDRDRTRAEILDVATQHFAEHGYSGARVDEIAEQTRTTKRMLYYYFGSKEGLYTEVLDVDLELRGADLRIGVLQDRGVEPFL